MEIREIIPDNFNNNVKDFINLGNIETIQNTLETFNNDMSFPELKTINFLDKVLMDENKDDENKHYETKDFHKLSPTKLKELIKAKGINIDVSKMKKNKLIEILETSQ
jgi:hypothetical protein